MAYTFGDLFFELGQLKHCSCVVGCLVLENLLNILKFFFRFIFTNSFSSVQFDLLKFLIGKAYFLVN